MYAHMNKIKIKKKEKKLNLECRIKFKLHGNDCMQHPLKLVLSAKMRELYHSYVISWL
jgi:hypothetical protein